jgi:membrane-associated phospholipid phosphatase
VRSCSEPAGRPAGFCGFGVLGFWETANYETPSRRSQGPKARRPQYPALFLAFVFPALLCAQTDTVTSQRPLFTWRDGVLAAGFVVGTVAIRPLDTRAAASLQRPRSQENRVLQDAAIGFRTIAVPGAVIIGVSMYTAGRLGKSDRLAELGLHGTEALFLGEGMASVLKGIFGRARPLVDTKNPDDYQLLRGFRHDDRFRSFPSGHTVAGFAAGAAVTAETSRWWPSSVWYIGPAMYGGAALVGLSRMYNNRHWASDVIMGAAIGTFAGTKVVRFNRTHAGNRIDRWFLRASASPSDLGHLTLSIVPLPR